MHTFRSPELSDRQWAVPLLAAEGCLGCEYNFNNMYLWSRAYPQKIARLGDRLLAQIRGRLGTSYLYPAGSGPLAPALDALREDAAAHGVPLTLICLAPQQRQRLEEEFPGRFSWQSDRDGWDYLYDVNRLADLGGKKLHAKRNHIHRFDDQFPDWSFEPITPDNVPECLDLERAWAARRRQDEPGGGEGSLSEETVAVIEALYQMQTLSLEGGLIRAGGKPLAFSLGSLTTPECFDVHFEKADGSIQGAYAVINREMARMVRDRHPQVRWLNREDDLGLEGLRKAKLSYYPDLMLEKYTAREV
ncbi:MAG TPA: phosphatidylglycerol lysyltransferase domain-containing protein [Firmicutes bacterium]|nr:phosphatidylglycerol lysyltransferase domain-containing protein [Bacillota bacterium]